MSGQEGELTKLNPIRRGAGSRMVLMVLDSFPDVPAPEIVDDVAVGVFYLVPFDDLDARVVDETGHVEDLSEGNGGGVSADVGGSEHGDNGHTLGERAEVNQVGVSHNIVCYECKMVKRRNGADNRKLTPSSGRPRRDVLGVIP